MNKRPYKFLVICIIAVALVGWMIWFWSRPKGPVETTRIVGLALAGLGDLDRVQVSLEPGKLLNTKQRRDLLNWLRPTFSGWTVKALRSGTLPNQAVTVFEARRDTGEVCHFRLIASKGPDGAVVSLRQLVSLKWTFPLLTSESLTLDRQTEARTLAEGVASDAQELAKLGFTGFTDEFGTFRTWDELRKMYLERSTMNSGRLPEP